MNKVLKCFIEFCTRCFANSVTKIKGPDSPHQPIRHNLTGGEYLIALVLFSLCYGWGILLISSDRYSWYSSFFLRYMCSFPWLILGEEPSLPSACLSSSHKTLDGQFLYLFFQTIYCLLASAFLNSHLYTDSERFHLINCWHLSKPCSDSLWNSGL